jgi:uncharacterized protein
MLCADVNVLVYAHRADSPEHKRYREWLDAARQAPEPIGLADIVASGFLRIVTHPRVFGDPTRLDDALSFVEALRVSPSVLSISPGDRHWDIFVDLCNATGARGNTIPDAYLAALAIEQGATWISADRGFGRFPGLRWQHPLDG